MKKTRISEINPCAINPQNLLVICTRLSVMAGFVSLLARACVIRVRHCGAGSRASAAPLVGEKKVEIKFGNSP